MSKKHLHVNGGLAGSDGCSEEIFVGGERLQVEVEAELCFKKVNL